LRALFGSLSIEIKAPKRYVWEALVRAKEWPEWNTEIKSVRVDEALAARKKFVWGPAFPKIKSEVVLFVAEEMLIWVGTMMHFKAIHSWKWIEKEGLTVVITEESLQGAMVTWIFGQKKLNDNLKNWLIMLKKQVESHPSNQVSSILDAV
jgi:hypothetical protein